MKRHLLLRGLVASGVAVSLALSTSACTYDYLQHTDRVGYSAGNAVKANLEDETTNPSKRSMYTKSGLGRNGAMPEPGVPGPTTTTTTATSTP